MQLASLRQIVKAEGYGALWYGLSARVAFHIPSSAVCWGVYETVKDLLKVS
jgi:solute carrier family 25 (mitochondrial iron transporter), member 28/37